MSCLSYNATAAEQFLDCSFVEGFENSLRVYQNNGTITGTPLVNNGITLNGTTDYVTYRLSNTEFKTTKLSIVIIFYPNFAYDINETKYFYGIDDGSSTTPGFLIKRPNAASNTLRLVLKTGASIEVPSAAYSPYWRVNQRNVFVFSGSSGSNNIWFNGIQVVSNDATAWNLLNDVKNHLVIGASYINSLPFDGKITKVLFFKSLLTEQDAINYYNNTNDIWQKDLLINLPMTMKHHDPVNKRTFDISGNSNHFQFGDNSTPTTYPTKLARRSYSFDGGDYLYNSNISELTGNADFSIGCTFSLSANSDGGLICRRDGDNDGFQLMYDSATTSIIASYNTIDSSVVISSYGYINNIVVTFDVSGNQRLYLNGNLVDSDDISGQTIDTSFNGLYIGSLGNGAASPITYLTGKIYNIFVSSTLLSSLQVASHYLDIASQINRI